VGDPAQILLWVVALPVAVAAAVGVPALALGRGDPAKARKLGWLGALALGAGYMAGHLGVLGWPRSLQTTLTTEWLPLYAALLGVGLGVLEAGRFERGWRWLPRFAASAVLLGFMLKAKVVNTWEAGEAVGWIAAAAVGCGVSWLFLDVLRHSPPTPDDVEVGEGGPGAALAALALLSSTAVVLVMGSSLKLGLLGGVLAAAWGPFLVLTWFRRDVPALRGAFPVLLLVWQALVLRGVFYASLPKLAAVLLIGSFFGSGLGTWPLWHRRPWWHGALAATGLLLVFAGAAGGVTYYVTVVQAEAEAEQDSGPDYGSAYDSYGPS
jgi:hypothetical protein